MELRCTQCVHYSVEDSELSSGQSTNHNTTWEKSNSTEINKTNFLGNVCKTLNHWSISSGSSLIHLREEGIGRVRYNGGSNSSNNTRSKRNGNILAVAEIRGSLSHGCIDSIGGNSLYSELGHSVRNLLG